MRAVAASRSGVVGALGKGVNFARLIVWKDADGLGAVDFGGFSNRHECVLSLIDQTDVEIGLPRFGPVVIDTGDRPGHGSSRHYLSFSAAERDGHVAIPDFMFHRPHATEPDWDQLTAKVASAAMTPPESQLLGWIGNPASVPARYRLLRWGEANPELGEIWASGVAAGRRSRRRFSRIARRRQHADISLSDQAKLWSYFIDVEGAGYSGRLKLQLHAGRPVLVADRPWNEWWFGDLVPFEHYIPVRRDLRDLTQRVRWARENADAASAIGRNGQAYAQKMLTKRRALERWAEVLHDVARRPPARLSRSMRQALPS